MDFCLDHEYHEYPDELPQSQVCRGQGNTECNNTYLTPTNTEPIYAELSEIHGNHSASQPEVNTRSSLLRSSLSLNSYITPVHRPHGRRHCYNESNTLLCKFLISVFLNIVCFALLTSSLYRYLKCCHKNGPDDRQLDISVVDWKRSEICFINQGRRCIAGSLKKSTDIQIINNEHFSPERKFQNEVLSLCCYDKSQSLQRLTHLFWLVKAHNEVKKICTNCSTQHIVRTSDISMACRISTSEQGLLLTDKHNFANVCKGGVQVKKTSMHLLYLFLAINCSLHGNNVIKAGVKFNNQLIAQTERQCDISLGVVTLSLFSFRNLTNGSKLLPFVSDTKCVNNDPQSNRFEILVL